MTFICRKNMTSAFNSSLSQCAQAGVDISDLFRLYPSTLCAPVTEHVSLHSKSLCENITRASGGANNIHPLSWGGD